MNDQYDDAAAAEVQALSDPQAEMGLLSACLASKTARQAARRHITGADFYNPHHETIWDVLSAMDRDGTGVDAVTVSTRVRTLVAPTGRPSSTRAWMEGLLRLLAELITYPSIPDNADFYAETVRDYATRRRLAEAGTRLRQQSMDTSTPPATLAAKAVRALTMIRDHGANADVTALTLTELMDVPDDNPTWVIPGLLETGDRLMLTGSEGAGKSALSRQIGVMAAAGIHPFSEAMMPPIRAAFVDCENKASQVRRQVRPLVDWIGRHGLGSDPMSRVVMDFPGRIDITRDRDLAAIHRLLDATQPDLLVIGPLYRMSTKALNNDDDAAPFLVALDTIMERGVALIIEAHAGHAKEGQQGRGDRSLRPRGSSSLLGWPEFGLGLRGLPGGIADLEPWRGGREARDWPTRMRRSPGNRWTETYPDDRGDQGWQAPPPPPDEPPSDPQGALV